MASPLATREHNINVRRFFIDCAKSGISTDDRKGLLILLDFCNKFGYNIFVIQNHCKGCAWLAAACHNRTYAIYLTTIVFIVRAKIPRLNKNTNAHSGITRQPGYRYQMERRRKQFKKGYKFNPKMRGWIIKR